MKNLVKRILLAGNKIRERTTLSLKKCLGDNILINRYITQRKLFFAG